MAGLVPRGQNPGDLDLEQYVSATQQRGMSVATVYSLVAAQEAMEQADWKPEEERHKQRTGLFN